MTLNPWFPELFDWFAQKYVKEGDDDIERKIYPYQAMIYPECRVILSRRKNPKKLKQDGKFDGKGCKTIEN